MNSMMRYDINDLLQADISSALTAYTTGKMEYFESVMENLYLTFWFAENG